MIGVFSIISVMTTISALQSSIENGLTFLGSNIFQFSKYPSGFETFGDERYKNRRNLDYQTYLNFARLVDDTVELICPKVWDDGVQAVYQNKKTDPNLVICGTNQGFIAANNFAVDQGRNLSNEDVEFSR